MPSSPEVRAALLSPRPPPLLARVMAGLLITAFAGGIALSVVLKLPETVSAPFVLRPARGADPVRAPLSGVVLELPVAEGARVASGDLLVAIQGDAVGERGLAMSSAMRDVSIIEAQTNSAAARNSAEAAARSSEKEGLRARVRALSDTLALSEQKARLQDELLSSAEALADASVLSAADRTAARLQATDAHLAAAELRGQLNEARAALGRLDQEDAAAAAVADDEVVKLGAAAAEAGDRVAALRASGLELDGGVLRQRAPCDAFVTRLGVRGPGAVVAAGDGLVELVCTGDALEAELELPASGSGRVAAGQTVKLYYEAFPYQRHGVQYGTVRWIGPGGTAEAPALRALVTLRDQAVPVGGMDYALLPGMSGRAEVVVGVRAPVEAVFEPLRALRENAATGG